jgi:uncharacterized membrane protein YgdD (TMEM256/DUF423 family)
MKFFAIAASIFGFLSVAAGAFGAHALREKLEPRMLEVWNTGADYQMYHALALLAVTWLATRVDSTATDVAGWSFVVGILLFSGSLYTMALSGVRWLGAITPLGGVSFLVGWIALAVAASRLS